MDTFSVFTEIGRMAYAVAKSNGEVKEKEVENIFYFIDEEMEELRNYDVMVVGAPGDKVEATSGFVGSVTVMRRIAGVWTF